MAKELRKCSWCGALNMRHAINPNTRKPILNAFCNTECKGNWQRENQKPNGVNKDWLVQKYQIENLDCAEIGRLVGRDTKRVWEWLRDYRIPIRPRGSSVSKQWINGTRVHNGGFPHTDETKQKIREKCLKDGRVPYLTKNGNHYMKGRRGSAHHGWRGGLTPEREAMAQSQEWKDSIKAVWKRADAKCERCLKDHRLVKDRKVDAFDIHHIVSFQIREMRTVVSNLVLLCEPCHYWVHSKKNVNKDFLKEAQNEPA